MSTPLHRGSPAESAATVSVVVCFYNAEAYLSEAIDSVVRQTHPRWELVLVDDGSTDGGTSIARAAAAGDPARVRYAEHPNHENRGKSTSRNLGLSLACGEHVVFLDADDVLLPHKLAHQATILDADRRTDAVYGRTCYWHDAAPGRRDRISRLWVPWDRVHEPPELLVRFLRRPGSVPCLCAVMARREVVLRLGGFDESIQDLYEDQVLISKLALNGRIRVDLNCGEKYRQHAGSSSSQAIRDETYHPWRPNPARRAYLVWLRRYVAHQSSRTRDAVNPALRRAWRPYRHPDAYRLIARPAHEWASRRDRVLRRLRPEPLDAAACGSERD